MGVFDTTSPNITRPPLPSIFLPTWILLLLTTTLPPHLHHLPLPFLTLLTIAAPFYTTGSNLNDYALGSHLIMQLYTYGELCIFNNLHKMKRVEEGGIWTGPGWMVNGKAIGECGWWERFRMSLSVWGSMRRLGWSNEVKGTRPMGNNTERRIWYVRSDFVSSPLLPPSISISSPPSSSYQPTTIHYRLAGPSIRLPSQPKTHYHTEENPSTQAPHPPPPHPQPPLSPLHRNPPPPPHPHKRSPLPTIHIHPYIHLLPHRLHQIPPKPPLRPRHHRIPLPSPRLPHNPHRALHSRRLPGRLRALVRSLHLTAAMGPHLASRMSLLQPRVRPGGMSAIGAREGVAPIGVYPIGSGVCDDDAIAWVRSGDDPGVQCGDGVSDAAARGDHG